MYATRGGMEPVRQGGSEKTEVGEGIMDAAFVVEACFFAGRGSGTSQ